MIRSMPTLSETPTGRVNAGSAVAHSALTDSALRRAARWLAGGGRWLALCVVVLAVLARPAPARADEDPINNDGRLEGFTQIDEPRTNPPRYKELPVAMQKSGTGGTWIIFILLTVVGVAVLFKNAKRTHLD